MNEDVSEVAAARFAEGCSCAQAVLSACAPAMGMTPEMAMRLGSGFGAGLGGLRETCGAVTAMVAVIGLRRGSETPMDVRAKADFYKEIQSAVADFDVAFGTHGCLELLRQASIRKQSGEIPEARTPDYYARRPCSAFVRFCAARALR